MQTFRKEVDALKNTIKRTVDEVLKEKREIAQTDVDLGRVDERLEEMDSRVKSLERAVKDSESLVKKALEKELKGLDINKAVGKGMESSVSELRKDVEMLRNDIESSSTKKLEEELDRQVGSLRSEVNGLAAKSKALDQRLASAENVKGGVPMPPVPTKDTQKFLRDMEIIKTKQEWIENNIERIDVRPLMKKMEELEHRIRVLKVSSPIVLE